MKPFDFLNAVNHNKTNIIEDSDNPELAESLYTPFLVNRGLSYFTDTILYANEMNIRHHCDHKLQFDFYLNTIRKRKRFSKWFKKEDNEDIDVVREYYKVDYSLAMEYMSILNDNQIEELRRRLYKGDN